MVPSWLVPETGFRFWNRDALVVVLGYGEMHDVVHGGTKSNVLVGAIRVEETWATCDLTAWDAAEWATCRPAATAGAAEAGLDWPARVRAAEETLRDAPRCGSTIDDMNYCSEPTGHGSGTCWDGDRLHWKRNDARWPRTNGDT